jgi:hypothetical protein
LVELGTKLGASLEVSLGVGMTKEPVPVGSSVLVELDTGNDAQLVVVEVVVLVRPGQLLTVGLHEVTVTVWVRVWVEVVVLSASWAATRERPVARTARMLLYCILTFVWVTGLGIVVGFADEDCDEASEEGSTRPAFGELAKSAKSED